MKRPISILVFLPLGWSCSLAAVHLAVCLNPEQTGRNPLEQERLISIQHPEREASGYDRLACSCLIKCCSIVKVLTMLNLKTPRFTLYDTVQEFVPFFRGALVWKLSRMDIAAAMSLPAIFCSVAMPAHAEFRVAVSAKLPCISQKSAEMLQGGTN